MEQAGHRPFPLGCWLCRWQLNVLHHITANLGWSIILLRVKFSKQDSAFKISICFYLFVGIGRERERESRCSPVGRCFSAACHSWAGPGWKRKSRRIPSGNSTWHLSHVGGRNRVNGASTHCPLGSALAGDWSQEPEVELQPRYLPDTLI